MDVKGKDSCDCNDVHEDCTSLDIVFSNVKFPHFKLCNERLKTFLMWPKFLRPRPAELAEAGFFYRGQSDIVQCFNCGIRLKDWEGKDNAYDEHRRWSPFCDYIHITRVIPWNSVSLEKYK